MELESGEADLNDYQRSLLGHTYRAFDGLFYQILAFRQNDGPWITGVDHLAERTINILAVGRTVHHAQYACDHPDCTNRRRACRRRDCIVSTGICGHVTFGTGKLDEYGYWEHGCELCARAYEKRNPGKKTWPSSPEPTKTG